MIEQLKTIREALEQIKLRDVSLADAQVTALEVLPALAQLEAMVGEQEPVPRDVVRDADLALDLLEKLFDAYENGPACYEDQDEYAGYLGNAVQLDNDTFHACADLLNRRRPIAAIAQQKGGV